MPFCMKKKCAAEGFLSDRNRDFLISGQKKSTPEDAVVSGALGGI